jgi:hypothetical protein
MPNFTDTGGQPIRLGARLGVGGEGSVHEVLGHPDIVAKIYHQPLTSERAQKIVAMASLPCSELQKTAAWPSGLVMAGQVPSGLLMPKVSGGKDTHVVMQLVRCKQEPNHFYVSSSRICPWCQIEGATGVILFNISVLPTGILAHPFSPGKPLSYRAWKTLCTCLTLPAGLFAFRPALDLVGLEGVNDRLELGPLVRAPRQPARASARRISAPARRTPHRN